jgi:hypothetical protein
MLDFISGDGAYDFSVHIDAINVPEQARVSDTNITMVVMLRPTVVVNSEGSTSTPGYLSGVVSPVVAKWLEKATTAEGGWGPAH